MSSKKTILICPLNWGLGHATRMIPIINDAISQGHSVIIGSDGDALLLLQKQFPNHRTIELPQLKIKYGTGFFSAFQFLISVPKILAWIKKDNKKLQGIVDEYKIDLIISDNRWGLWNNAVKSVFVTHQLMVKMPKPFSFLEKIGYKLQQRYIKHFDKIWIPDFADKTQNLSGDLSHKYIPQKPIKYIGILSQFSKLEHQSSFKYDIAVILSGPEPHRSILEKMLLEKIETLQVKAIVIGGKLNNQKSMITKNVSYIPFANTEELQTIYSQSKHIICRSGYTSLMDLITIGKSAIIIPTPSQTEQEYLAKYLSEKDWYLSIKQDDIKEISMETFEKLNQLKTIDLPIKEQKAFSF